MPQKKLLIISNYAPPQTNGSSIMLGRILDGLPRGSYTLLTNTTTVYQNTPKTGRWLPCNYHFIDQESSTPHDELEHMRRTTTSKKRSTWDSFAYIFSSIRTLLKIPKAATQIDKRQPLRSIVATSDNGPFLIGGYLAAKRLQLPLHVYLFDLYAGNALPLFAKWLAAFFEPKIFEYAKTIVVTNRHTKQFLQDKYGFKDSKFVICPNPAQVTNAPHQVKPTDKKTIVFTGNVYWAQAQNLQDLVQAVRDIPDIELQIHAPLSQEQFKSMGLTGGNVVTGALTQEESLQAQQQATALFLPMTFGQESKDIVMTASPGKLSDYLSTGRPILVYAPPYSQIARYATEEGFALVVDQKNVDSLHQAVKRLISDEALQKKLAAHAQALYKKDFDMTKNQAIFRNAVLGSK